jgi:hypothetical protein
MKRFNLLILALLAIGSSYAKDYGYLTMELVDGTKISYSVTDLNLQFGDSEVTVSNGEQTGVYKTADLAKMYFSEDSETSGVASVGVQSSQVVDVYNLQGVKVGSGTTDNLPKLAKGIYLLKSKTETSKLIVK